MSKKKHLLFAFSGSIFLGACVYYYFFSRYQDSPLANIGFANIAAILFALIIGIGSSAIGYHCSTGNMVFDAVDSNANKFRQAINNPKNLIKVFMVIGYVSPFLIGIGIVSDAIRGF